MAGIEKICEYSGFSPIRGDMYKWKKNLIQVNPEFRKLFRGKYFELFQFLSEPERIWTSQGDKYIDSNMYDYCLYVPSLPGIVDGFYYNYTYEWGTVKRKIKRLMQAKQLKVNKIPLTLDEVFWLKKHLGLDALGYNINNFLLQLKKLSKNEWQEIITEVENEYI